MMHFRFTVQFHPKAHIPHFSSRSVVFEKRLSLPPILSNGGERRQTDTRRSMTTAGLQSGVEAVSWGSRGSAASPLCGGCVLASLEEQRGGGGQVFFFLDEDTKLSIIMVCWDASASQCQSLFSFFGLVACTLLCFVCFFVFASAYVLGGCWDWIFFFFYGGVLVGSRERSVHQLSMLLQFSGEGGGQNSTF